MPEPSSSRRSGAGRAARPDARPDALPDALPDDPLDDVVEASGDGVVVHAHVQPRAGRPGLVGRHGTALRIRVKAPPVGGRANEETAAVLAAALGVPTRAVALVGGATSRVKRFRVGGIDAGDARRRLRQALAGPPA